MSLQVATGLSKAFGALDVFEGVDLRIEAGDRVGMVGPNGAGKTTLLRILAGAMLRVFESLRSQGAALAELERAKQAGAATLDLTSRPSREAANRLYRRIGFVQRETNVYRYALGR